MPYQIQVGSQVVEFPDSVGQDEAQRILSEQFPATGEDIAGAMQDPAYKPSVDDYLKFEQYSKTKQTDWINTIAQSVDAAAGLIGGAISEGAQGAVANPLNYIEGAAQGTRQLYGLVAQSQDPGSPLFKFKDLVAGTGTAESRYNQFLEARDFANTTARLERGEEGIVVPPEYTNPEFVQGVSMILDPTLALPGIGEVLGAGKLATRAVGKGAQLTGRAVAGVARPLERIAGAAERMTAEALGMTPEALRNTAATAGLAGALGIAPEAAAFAAIPAGIRTAREAGEALTRAGENLVTQPSRVGPLEAIGAAPGANLRQRMLGVVGQYGGDIALDASLRGIAGGIEGAAVGAGLGFLSGGEEGAAAGLGSGLAQGAAGALGARGFERLTGKAAAEARAGDLGRFIDAQQDPTTKALFERVRDQHGVNAASALMDLQGLVRGKFGDIDILYRSNAQMAEKFGDKIRGVQIELGERPTIFINADILGKGTGDGPLYTLGHELFHALEKTTQLEGGATEIKDSLVGRWAQEGDVVRKLAEGAFNDAEIEARFNQYRDKLAAGSQERADQLAQYDTIDKKAGYVASELAAEHFAGLLAGQKPDALLKGFTGITRQLLDSALTQNASRALADAAATIERTFGVKPTDSVLFPDLKQASPQVNAMLRDLLRARRKLDERITIENEGPGKVLKPQDVSNPIAAKQLVDLGVAEQMPDGSVRNLSDEEIRVREEKDTAAIRTILEGISGARVVDGEILGRFSPQQLSAIEQSQAVSSRMKDKIRAVNAAMDAGNSIFLNYGAATKRVKNRLTGKFTSKYNSGIRLSQREVLPYSFYLSKADNPVIKAIDISKIRGALDKLTAPDGSVAAGLWDNVDGFMSDLAAYFTNLDAGEGARRSAEIFGVDKARFLGDFVNEQEKGGRKFVRDFRLDRIGSTAPMDFRARISEDAIQKSKLRWMPAETIGDKSVINSEEGYRIISGAKHKLYGPDGKLIGIYDTQTQAERKADATQARLQPEVRQQQRVPGDEGRQTAEAGGRNRALGGQEGQGEGGAVRQAGDVVQNFDALVAAAPDVRFMPVESQPENAPVAGRITKGQQASIDELSQYYASKTPDRAKVLKSDAIDSLASRLINKGVPVQEANAIASKTFSKLRKGVSGALQVISGMGLSDLSRMAGTGKPSVERRPHINQNWLTSAFEAFATDEGLALMKAQQVATQLNKADQAKAAAGESVEAARASGVRQSTMQQGMEFVLGEMNADRKAFGTSLREDLDSPPRVYASVGEGQKFGGQGNYNVFFEWKKETPMVVTSHHHYGVANGVTGIHAQGNIGDKNARSFGNPSAEKYDTLPSGKQVLDTHLLVGNQGVPDARAHQLTVSIPDSSLSGIRSVYKEKGAAGVEAELNRIAVSQMVGTKSQGKTKAFTSKEGIPPMVAIQKNRTEAYVLNPDLANVASVTIVSNSPKEVALIRKNIEKAFENNGSALPKVKVVSAESGASGNVGRKAITDEYFKLTGEQRFMPAGDMATGRSVKDHREAMDLFEKGYRLYGALYDGMEDPVRLKKVSEIERFDPENLWAVPSKKIAAAISVRNMPASDTDYLSAVKKGDTVTAQRMVDEAAKAAGYTIGPVYHGTPTGGFNVFDKRMRGETSGVSRQAFSFTTDKKAAEGYSKRLGDEAVRLDAGLRVANDAMRMFDEDVAAQEYFSSKGYSSVEDGMLPEFDWGSIDDVPEFIKELRGHAKDLKPINKRLSDSFIEAAKVMTSTKAVPEVKRVFLRIPEGAPVFQATPQTLGQVMSGFSAENQPTKAGIVELPGNERIYYVADSSQVKLVDAITKDDSGNVIPLSQRFKATSEDIRFMPETIQRDVGRNQDFANPPTDTEAVDALSSEKKAKFGAARSIKPGTQVAARIDIPAFLRTGKYVVAVHEPDGAAGGPGKVIGYDTVTRLQNPKFVVKPGVQRIYEGKSAKFPVATVDGKIMADRSIPADLENYVAVGMDPKEHAFFYDKRTDQPVIGGSESVSVGNTVFVKNPVYGKPEDFRYMPSPDSAMPGAYSFPGGYRALPGKAKGSLRLYGPAGSLIGIAASLDEAQRILRRKNK
jgi:hypothetical protein